jgi:hypothetical protein
MKKKVILVSIILTILLLFAVKTVNSQYYNYQPYTYSPGHIYKINSLPIYSYSPGYLYPNLPNYYPSNSYRSTSNYHYEGPNSLHALRQRQIQEYSPSALFDDLKSVNSKKRQTAVELISRFIGNKQVEEAVIKIALEDPCYGVRKEAVLALRKANSLEAINCLKRVEIGDPYSEISSIAKKTSIKILYLSLQSTDKKDRIEGLKRLSGMNLNSEEFSNVLVKVLTSDPDPEVRMGAIELIGKLDKEAINNLIPTLKRLQDNDPVSKIRERAKSILEQK